MTYDLHLYTTTALYYLPEAIGIDTVDIAVTQVLSSTYYICTYHQV